MVPSLFYAFLKGILKIKLNYLRGSKSLLFERWHNTEGETEVRDPSSTSSDPKWP